jgi:hypothetical protein
MPDESSPKTLSIPATAWTVSAIIVALFLVKATGQNPPEYYVNVRWLTLVVAVVGAWATFRFEHLGWTFAFFGLAVLFNPIAPLRLDRSVWFVLDWLAAVILIAGAFLLRWDNPDERLAKARDVVDKFFLYSLGAVWTGVLVHLAIVMALLPVTYAVYRNEDLIDEWTRFRDHHLWVVGAATLGVVALYFRYALRRRSGNG